MNGILTKCQLFLIKMKNHLFWLQIKHIYERPRLVAAMFAIYGLYIFLLVKSYDFLPKNQIITEATVDFSEFFKFPLVFGTTAWLASFFTIFWALWFIAFIMPELNGGGFENPSYRKSFVKGKLMILFLIMLDWTTMAILGGLLIGWHFGKSNLEFFPWQLIELPVQIFVYLTLAFLFAVVTRSLAKAYVYFIGYFVAEALARQVLFSLNLTVAHYFPLKIATRMVEPPSVDFLSQYALNEYLGNNPFPVTLNLLLGLLYGSLFLFLAFKFLNHKKTS